MVTGNSQNAGGAFPETSWTTITQARDADPEVAVAALGRLVGRYQSALRTFLLRSGCPPQDVDDVLHGFLERRFLRETFLRNVDAETGLFRTFLRTCLRRFLISHHRATTRRLDVPADEGSGVVAEGTCEAEADRLMDRAWAEQVIANARARLREEAQAAGRIELCDAMEGLLDADPAAGAVEEVARRLGMKPNAVWVASHRFRERLRWFIQDEVRQTVREPGDWKAELAHLVAALRA